MTEKTLLSGDQIAELGLTDWRPLRQTLQAHFETGDFGTGLRFVTEVAAAAEAANHHPDVDLRYGFVRITLTSHDVSGKTQRDVDLASRITQIAHGLGLTARPDLVTLLELGLDTWDAAEVAPFWQAVLGLTANADLDHDLIAADNTTPSLWFQPTDRHEEPRQRFHLDLWVAPDTAEQRIADAVAAGGTLVSDAEAPRFWVLADPQGNKVCLCTHQTRSH